MDKAEFIHAMGSPTDETIKRIDSQFCGCGYVWHWIRNMDSGKWNPMLTELDYELRGVENLSQLYDFLISRT